VAANGVGQEVFHVSQNQFTYDEAPAVCAAYGAQLASLEQVIEAYNGGAEWCGYGWSSGGMALYPTQKRTWEELQREIDPGKRTACGRPGVNGGYMDPTLKFGVNCFGFKPIGDFTPPAPVPGTDKKAFDDMVSKFKEMLNTMQLSPFSRMEWSGYDSTTAGQVAKASRSVGKAASSLTEKFTTQRVSGYGSQFQQDLGRLVESFDAADPTVIEAANTIAAYDPKAPYGLRGNPGERGPPGPVGPASTVPGPRGEDGKPGNPGERGPPGPEGRVGPTSTVPGPTGPQGRQGDPGRDGAAAAAGATGPAGPTGPQGRQGDPGREGPASTVPGPKGDPGPKGSGAAIEDTREVNSPPSYYLRRGMGIYNEFKVLAKIGLPGPVAAGVLETTVPWWDLTGGSIQQRVTTGTQAAKRASKDADTWTPWVAAS
jgi:hypothetical protein